MTTDPVYQLVDTSDVHTLALRILSRLTGRVEQGALGAADLGLPADKVLETLLWMEEHGLVEASFTASAENEEEIVDARVHAITEAGELFLQHG